jgi:hypothetical protein
MAAKTPEKVRPGDVVEVAGRHVGDPGRMGEVVEVIGDPTHPHYRVRWEDGHESTLYPGESVSFRRRSGRVTAARR